MQRELQTRRPPGVPLQPVCETHEPLDYAHFCEMTEDRKPSGLPRLELGKCVACPSHISYPVPAGLGEDEDELIASDRATTEDDIDAACPIVGRDVDPEGLEDVVWQRLPEPMRAGLLRYIEHRIAPGGFLRAFLEGDIDSAKSFATSSSWAARFDLAYWVYSYAPRESFGSVDAVASWLEGSR